MIPFTAPVEDVLFSLERVAGAGALPGHDGSVAGTVGVAGIEVVPPPIRRRDSRSGVAVSRYYLQRMKTRRGSCNGRTRHIRLDTKLVKKPKDLLECVVVHEMAHLLEPDHGKRFVALLDRHRPAWQERRAELNGLPLGPDDRRGTA